MKMSKKSKKRVLKPKKSAQNKAKPKNNPKKKPDPIKKSGKATKTRSVATKSKKQVTTPSKARPAVIPQKEAKTIAKPGKGADVKTKLRYLYTALYSKVPPPSRKSNNYNTFQTCLSEYLNSIGRDRWSKFGKFKDISRTLWAKYKSYPIARLCQNIDEVFENEFNEFFPTRNSDVLCLNTDFSSIEWFNFRDTLYFNLLESPCLKLIDKIYFIGTPGVIDNIEISADKSQNIDNLHEELKILFHERPSPPPVILLLKVEESSRGRLLLYYMIESKDGEQVDVSYLPQIEAADLKEFGPKPGEPVVPVPETPVVPITPTPPAEGSRLAELQEERKIAEIKLESDKAQLELEKTKLEREKMFMERIKIASELGLTGDALMQFINLKS